MGSFDSAALIEAIDNQLHGQTELDRATQDYQEVTVATRLLTGQWVYGVDVVMVK